MLKKCKAKQANTIKVVELEETKQEAEPETKPDVKPVVKDLPPTPPPLTRAEKKKAT